MTEVLVLELPWPHRSLHPNARVHWAERAKRAKKARADAAWVAKQSGASTGAAGVLTVLAVFHPPNSRRRDLDGMLSSIKPYLDGVSDATGVDDSLFAITIHRGLPIHPGSVRLEIARSAA